MGGPEMAPIPPSVRRAPAKPWRSSRVAPPVDAGYSRMVSNWNLQPSGVSAFIALKPDMVS